MADETNPTQDSAENPSTETLKQENMIPQSRFNEVNNQLKELKKQLDESTKSQREKEAAMLAEQGKYKELYELSAKELAALRNASEEAKQYRQSLEATNQARIARIPEDKRSLIPEYDNPVKLGAWLDANESLIGAPARPIAPNMGGGAGGVNQQSAFKLTAEQVATAKRFGMTEEDFAKSLGLLA